MNTMAQKRSQFALNQLMESNINQDFATLAAGLPAMILQNGFGHTLAFLLAKGSDKGKFKENDRHIQLFDIVVRWLVDKKILQTEDRREAVLSLSSISQAKYLQAQEEALLILEWVKRYSNAGLF